jgi:hypothetical protein
MDLFVTEVDSFFRSHMPSMSAAEFFRRLVNDPDVQLPSLLVMLDASIRTSTEYRAYHALKDAVTHARLD